MPGEMQFAGRRGETLVAGWIFSIEKDNAKYWEVARIVQRTEAFVDATRTRKNFNDRYG